MNHRNNFQKNVIIKDKDKPNERQMKAENYLKEYDIQNILTEMINYLLHKRSKNPILEMIKYLVGLLTEKEREKYGTNLGFIMKANEIDSNNKIGIMLGDADCLKKFRDLYQPIICKAHNLDKDNLKYFTANNFNLNNLKFDDIKKINLDEINGINKITINISRNLIDEPFVTSVNVENRTENVLDILEKEIQKIKTFRNFQIQSADDYEKILSNINYDLDFFKVINAKEKLVQKYRRIYNNEDNSSMVLINFCDNFQFSKNIIFENENKNEIKETRNDLFIKAFNELTDFLRNLQYYLGFEFEHNFGFLTTNISLLGTGFNITTEINLNKLCEDKFDFEKIKNNFNIFDKYSDNYKVKNVSNKENLLIFSSSPKISQSSIPEFLINYFEKIMKFKNG